MNAVGLPSSRLLPADLLRVGSVGLRTRKLRATLSALGIAIGIASMVAVLGISASSRAGLLSALDRLGTNLLKVAPGQSFSGSDAKLPRRSTAMLARVDGVEGVAAVSVLDVSVRRNDRIPKEETGGLAVAAADPELLRTLAARMVRGRFLNAATSRYPAVVLGSQAAAQLGIDRPGMAVQIGDHRFTVVGILAPVELAPDLNSSVLVGGPVAERLLGWDGSPSTVYVRADAERVSQVRSLLGRTASPERPEEVNVSRPSDALAARAAAKTAFTSLLLGLGAVALLVGGVGIANVMVISVLERRSEIGLRRALGATRRHIAAQFVSESLLLAALGGAAGAALGGILTLAYAQSRGWEAVVPGSALGLGLAASLAIGAVAGLYPALRAARLSPTEALRSA